MGLIHIELFATLDLVGQAPGGPDEDPEGFPFGGWQAPLLDDVSGAQVVAAYEGTDALLVQTPLRERLVDRLDLRVHPLVLGVGKEVFDGGAVPTNVTLLEPPVAGPRGTVYLRYGLADGTPATGGMSAAGRGVGEG